MDRTERGANQPESAGGLGRLPDQRVMKVKHVEPPHEKMMAYLDGELPEKARLQFERLLEKHPEWRVEMADMAALIGATKQLKLKPPAAKVWDRYWEEIDNKLGRQMGWALALAGGCVGIAQEVGATFCLQAHLQPFREEGEIVWPGPAFLFD